MSEPITFTQQAALKVWQLIQEEGNTQLKLRAYVTGGGCSGFQYGFSFDESVQEDDTVICKEVPNKSTTNTEDDEGEGEGDGNSVQLLVDPLSLQYLMGAEIDYKEDIEGEQFIIRNPNAKTTCGCGSSFTMSDDE